MASEQVLRIAAYLSQYIVADNGFPVLPSKPDILKKAIKMVMDGYGMTEEDVKKEALSDFDVIIPYDWFPKKEENKE